MQINSLVDSKILRQEKMDPYQYTVSLLKEGFRAGQLGQSEIENIQLQSILLLKELIERYTKGESSSVTADTAERLLGSVYFCLDTRLKGIGVPQEALAELKTRSVREIYESGIAAVMVCVEESKALFHRVWQRRLAIPLDAYNATLSDLPGFFEKYSVVFGAQDAAASIDYPLVFDDMRVCGVFYIRNYLEHLDIETEFCHLFPLPQIIRIFEDFSRICSTDYRKTLTNIFEIVMNNAVFSVLAGNEPGSITLTEDQSRPLQTRIMSCAPGQIPMLVEEAVARLVRGMGIREERILEYVHRYEGLLAERIQAVMRSGSLGGMIMAGEDRETHMDGMLFQDGERMDNTRFGSVMRGIARCSGTQGKIRIILSSIRSSQDFIDILEGDCLFGREFTLLFGKLGDVELAVLGRAVFYDELRNGPVDFKSIDFGKKIRELEMEKEWQQQYARFLAGVCPDRLTAVGNTINRIRLGFELD